MKFQDDIDFTTLSWIKTELDATLQLARTALEAYVENPADAEQMRSCVSHLHLVHGTLRMVELYGAALIVEEMERVANGLAEGTISRNEDVYSVLMRGIVQLPDYLERLQSGHKDIPIILLPLLNDLRATRGEKLLTESVLFTPDLKAPLPPASASALNAADLRGEALRLRNAYQIALLRWIRDESGPAQLGRMADVLDRLYTISTQDNTRRVWWVANGVLDGVRSGAIPASVTIKLLFGKVDREIKRLVDEGENAFISSSPPRDLTKNLLYYLAHASVETPRATEIRQLYKLDSLLPSAQELEHAHGSISGHNRALLDTVAAAIKDDLLHVKEALDIFLRSSDNDPGELAAQTDVLDRVADTLGMLGLGVSRRMVIDQRAVVSDIANGMRKADESTLLDVAGSLLYVEASLDDHIVRLGVDNLATDPSTGFELPKAEVSRILDALMREAAANIAQTKHDIIAFVEAPWDHARVEQTPRLLEEVSGALDMLSLHDAAQLIIGFVRFVEIELLQHRRVPNHEQMDLLADALASIEYYIEATREQRGGRERILEITRESLRALNYWPVPAAPAQRGIPSHMEAFPGLEESPLAAYVDAPGSQSAAANMSPVIEAAPPVIEVPSALLAAEPAQAPSPLPQPAAPANAGAATPVGPVEEFVPDPDMVNHGIDFGFSTDPAETLDSEIRDIFLEEVQEEINNLQTNLPLWRATPNDFELLRTIRRSFHTLKGSGRLVGAQALGDFSWKVENMLNRVLDKSVLPGEAVQTLIAHAVDALPDLLVALRGEGRPAVDVVAIKDVADQLAAGDEAYVNERTLRPRKRVMRPSTPVVAAPAEPVAIEAAPSAPIAPPEEPAGEGLPQFDTMLFDVLRSEVGTHLVVIDAFVAQAQPGITPVTPELLRATHTLSGAIAMVDLAQLSQVLMPLEGYIKRLQAWEQAPDTEGLAAIAESSAQVKATIAALESSTTRLPDLTSLIARVTELRDALPQPELLQNLLDSEEAGIDDTALLPELDLAPETPAAASEPAPPALSFDEPGSEPAEAGDSIAEALAALSASREEIAPPAPPPPLSRDEVKAFAELLPPAPPPESAPPPTEPAPVSFLDRLVGTPLPDSSFVMPPMDEPVKEIQPLSEDLTPSYFDDEPEAVPPAAFAPPPQEPAMPVDIVVPLPVETIFAPIEIAPVEPEEPASQIVPSVDLSVPEIESIEPVLDFTPAPAAPVAEIVPPPVVAAPPAYVPPPAPAPVAPSSAPAEAVNETLYPVPQIDEDLLEIFVQEAEEILDHADASMARLRETPNDRELVSSLQRDLHTVKGGAHMSGLTPIGNLGHAMESLFEAVNEQHREMSPGAVETLEHAFDRLHSLVQLVARRQPSTMPTELIQRIERLVSGEAEPVAAPGRAAAVAPPEPVTPQATATKPGADEEGEGRTAQEYIRVRAEMLDTMVNTAGEVAIYRSRLEQQIAGYRFNLVELDATVTRLREQLRKLELETEAQILSRYQRADEEGVSAFDPLELDRFSQLQQLSRSLSESVSDLSSIQGTFDELTRQAETLLLQQSRVNSDLQEGLMRTRMVPFDSLVPTLRRTLRQTASELGKRAQLKVEGAQGEMDRNLLERMRAPFEHMLRNALAHGIEMPADRIKAGKPAEGTVNIALSREATEVVLRVTDDGRGLNREAIRRKAIERGILAENAPVSDRDLYACILDSGFSTAESVTQIAGRGVGMDVVNNEIKQLGGSLTIESSPGRGANFTVRLPFTLAVTQAILVRLGEASYAIPMSAVQGVVRIARDELERRLANDELSYTYGGEIFTIYNLAGLLGVAVTHPTDDSQIPLLMTRSGDQRAAVRVDGVLGSREIVVKSVGPQVSSVPGILGATIMGDGSVVMILDLAPLLRRAAALREQGTELPVVPITPVQVQKRRLLVMVVDDSITMRKATTRVLERQDMEVITAKDGLDAVEKLQDHIPDIVVLDIEMPRMDGYELATYMKNDARTRKVPIIMVTSRTGEKHRQRAQEIGVERYLGKPYQEAELLQNIHQAMAAVT